jgi:predicted nucleic acid-binding protein
MKIYAESSAVLAWLLREPAAEAVRDAFAAAEMVVASDLTLVECDRVLIRAAFTGDLPELDAARRRALLEKAAAHWHLLRVDRDVVERTRRPFPGEPLRTLDAVHVASAVAARQALPGLSVLSLDQRVRESAAGLGFRVLPAQAAA